MSVSEQYSDPSGIDAACKNFPGADSKFRTFKKWSTGQSCNRTPVCLTAARLPLAQLPYAREPHYPLLRCSHRIGGGSIYTDIDSHIANSGSNTIHVYIEQGSHKNVRFIHDYFIVRSTDWGTTPSLHIATRASMTSDSRGASGKRHVTGPRVAAKGTCE